MYRSAADVTEVPTVVVTVTSTVDGNDTVPGAVAVMVFPSTTMTLVAGVAPKFTVAPATKLVPEIVTVLPPPESPCVGLRPVTVGKSAKVYWSAGALIGEVPPAVVTLTSTVPAACAGVVTVIEVAETTLMLVPAAPPKSTVAPEMKCVPVMVTDVPPAELPEIGLTAVTVGVTAL